MSLIILEYVWLDGNKNLRSKYRTVTDLYTNLDWNYDGSSTHQASTENSEIILKPVQKYKNPFIRETESFIVLCDTYIENESGDLIPTETNQRYRANEIFNQKLELKPWFGIEQEYFMMLPNYTNESFLPLSFSDSQPKEQGDYYCGVGNQHVKMRELVEKHYTYCLYAGLKISGVNAEVAPNQWEFQVGPCLGIEAGDELWVSRYILHKLSEQYNVNISFRPKPIENPWNGSGLHTNFSTTDTRKENGLKHITDYVDLLEKKHADHINVYGDNTKRLSGICETSDINIFSCGYGNRGCSIRIPKTVLKNKCGYLEDRRPASDADPYMVTSIIFEKCC